MCSTALVNYVLRDEGITRGLDDIEARMIVEWLTDRAENLGVTHDEPNAWPELKRHIHRARVVARFVQLWAKPNSRGAAMQLITAERLNWPLPSGDIDAGALTEEIIAYLDRCDELAYPIGT